MLERLSRECSAPGCDRALTEDRHMLTMTTPGGTRQAYECACGAVTITVVGDGSRED